MGFFAVLMVLANLRYFRSMPDFENITTSLDSGYVQLETQTPRRYSWGFPGTGFQWGPDHGVIPH